MASSVRLENRLSAQANLAEALSQDWDQFRGNLREYYRSFRAAADFINFHGTLTIEDIYFFPQRKDFLRMFSAQEDYSLLPSWENPQEVRK
jgi:hypothetical protein